MPFLLITHRGPGHQKTGLFSFFDALTPPPKMLGGGGGDWKRVSKKGCEIGRGGSASSPALGCGKYLGVQNRIVCANSLTTAFMRDKENIANTESILARSSSPPPPSYPHLREVNGRGGGVRGLNQRIGEYTRTDT